MVELIVGCLISGQSLSVKTFHDFHQKYVEDDKERFIPDGWKFLKDDVDPCISWKTNVLDCASAAKRSKTKHRLCMLNENICLNAGTGLMEDHKRNSDGMKCDIAINCYQLLRKLKVVVKGIHSAKNARKTQFYCAFPLVNRHIVHLFLAKANHLQMKNCMDLYHIQTILTN
jgi:hypothetical protein